MNNQQMYSSLQEKFLKLLYELYDKKIDEIARRQKINRDKLLNEIGLILLKYKINDKFMDIDNIVSKKKLKLKMDELIDNMFDSEFKSENNYIEDLLNSVGMDRYYSNSYLYALGVNYTLKPVKQEVLDKIINKKIQGKIYSDRIWNNKNKVAKSIKKEINDFINGKTSVNEINSRLKKQFDVNWNNSNRLAINEIARVQEGCNEAWREEHNIKKVMYCATLDMKTCNDCGKNDGRIYDVNKAPEVPRHILCRCTLISVVDGWKPKTRLDNVSKERIDYKSYQEWKENQNI